MFAGLDHEHARFLLERAWVAWRLAVRSLCAAPASDHCSAQRVLIAADELCQRRRSYDRLLMMALPPGDLWAREDDPEWHAWLAWNQRLDAADELLQLTGTGGWLDAAWQLGGQPISGG
jgi:hypothetical protein